jgi:hypothetical protein
MESPLPSCRTGVRRRTKTDSRASARICRCRLALAGCIAAVGSYARKSIRALARRCRPGRSRADRAVEQRTEVPTPVTWRVTVQNTTGATQNFSVEVVCAA